jgi:hypothetical protein
VNPSLISNWKAEVVYQWMSPLININKVYSIELDNISIIESIKYIVAIFIIN